MCFGLLSVLEPRISLKASLALGIEVRFVCIPPFQTLQVACLFVGFTGYGCCYVVKSARLGARAQRGAPIAPGGSLGAKMGFFFFLKKRC
ncbi:hypothetical protein Hanom_Chr08g00727151 [Helianthus anomalus]